MHNDTDAECKRRKHFKPITDAEGWISRDMDKDCVEKRFIDDEIGNFNRMWLYLVMATCVCAIFLPQTFDPLVENSSCCPCASCEPLPLQ